MELPEQLKGMLEKRLDILIECDEGESKNFERMLFLLGEVGKYDVFMYEERYKKYLENGKRENQRTF